MSAACDFHRCISALGAYVGGFGMSGVNGEKMTGAFAAVLEERIIFAQADGADCLSTRLPVNEERQAPPGCLPSPVDTAWSSGRQKTAETPPSTRWASPLSKPSSMSSKST
jgi:hypothetical protein